MRDTSIQLQTGTFIAACGGNLIFQNNSESLLTVIRIGYNLDIMRQPPCLVVNPITVDTYAALFNCTAAVWASDTMTISA